MSQQLNRQISVFTVLPAALSERNKIMKNSYLKTLSRIIRYNLKTLIQFEFLFKFILSLIFLPAAAFCFNTAIKISGFTYLSLENITDFLLNPLSLLMLIVLIIFLTSITMLDISARFFYLMPLTTDIKSE